jgi:hypothetical protein
MRIALDVLGLGTSRHILFAWMVTSNGVNVGTDDDVYVGLLDDEGKFDG